ncbi:hypothetical protein V6N11_033970 [Hibiscus sabdariffa]|uniref:Uncharacterized protein n=1 Tax=Hibiscus sabdariffa TaxID=183260 RepID=A0ABR2S113_9ROSI
MEGGLRRVATRIGEMEEPIAIPICGWFDPPMLPRAKFVLLGLLKRIKANEYGCCFLGFTSMGVGSGGNTGICVGIGDSGWFLLG